jgi:hypothetical protein
MEERTHVECYSGSRYAERPVSFDFSGRRHLVKAIVEEWRSPSALHFSVKTKEDKSFELKYNERSDEWSITNLAADAPEQPKRG